MYLCTYLLYTKRQFNRAQLQEGLLANISCEKLQTTSQLQERGWNIQLYWLPGHECIHGNECADTLVKEAANSPAPNSAEELTLMASTRRTIHIEAANAWKTEWVASTRGNSLRQS